MVLRYFDIIDSLFKLYFWVYGFNDNLKKISMILIICFHDYLYMKTSNNLN